MKSAIVKVLFFAQARDLARVGAAEIALNDEPARVSDVERALIVRFPQLADLMKRARFAVNQEYVSRETAIRSGDELALIPPVSGG